MSDDERTAEEPPSEGTAPTTGRLGFAASFDPPWVLSDTEGHLQFETFHDLVATAIMAGHTVEFLAAHRYRVTGNGAKIRSLAEQIGALYPKVTFEVEQAPPRAVLTLDRHAEREALRFTTLHGRGDTMKALALALACRLKVKAIGLYRFEVSGSTARQIAWLSQFLDKSRAEVLKVMQITEQQAAEEDEAPAPIAIALPDRRTLSTVERDREGNILKVTQVETDVPVSA